MARGFLPLPIDEIEAGVRDGETALGLAPFSRTFLKSSALALSRRQRSLK